MTDKNREAIEYSRKVKGDVEMGNMAGDLTLQEEAGNDE